MNSFSPLRYPGGKQLLTGVLSTLISVNDVEGGVYAEPYAGGAGAALALLFSEYASRLLLNDADACIYAVWKAVLSETEAFCRMIRDVPLTVEEWIKQKSIYTAPSKHTPVEVGFATFYLNRTNRSGIIKNAGPIGGVDQEGTWKIDARFNRGELIRRIEKIASYGKRISISKLDAIDFVSSIRSTPKMLVYMAPPYFAKGRDLYLNHYEADDHKNLSRFITKLEGLLWVMSYDRCPQIEKLYRGFRQVPFKLSYSARERRDGQELFILSKGLKFPRQWRSELPSRLLRSA